MVQITKMRLPTCAEYSLLAETTNCDNKIMHWEGIYSWCQDANLALTPYHAARGYYFARRWDDIHDATRSARVGFRPTFEVQSSDSLGPDGTVITVGTLYMNDQPIRNGIIHDYIPGAKIELREALEDENYQLRAIRAGDVLIADRVMLRNISWNDIQEALGGNKPAAQPVNLGKMRLPTCAEYDLLAYAAKEDNNIMHWRDIFSWCQDADPNWVSYRAVRGFYSARHWSHYSATNRNVYVGFRPTFEFPDPDILGPDGAIVMVGTLYMNGKPVKVPQHPVWNGDIPNYVPGAKLELQEALDAPAYQVKAIRVGNVLIADRVLLKNISWNDCKGEVYHAETAPECSAPTKEMTPQIKSVRLPTSDEWDKMIDVMIGVNSRVHWKGTSSWCLEADPVYHDRRVVRGGYAGRHAAYSGKKSRAISTGFRPRFEVQDLGAIQNGDTVVVGTLFMNGIPVLANHSGSKSIPEYIPGARLEFREPVDDPRYHVKAIKVGCALIADRVLLRNISWDDLDKLGFCGNTDEIPKRDIKAKKMRLPTCAEYDLLADTAKEDNEIMHWQNMFSWCQDARPCCPSSRVVRGSRSTRYQSSCIAANRYVDVGFRPAFDILATDALGPDGTVVTVGTLYMAGEPVKVPLNPTWDGDILDYTPGAKLELREALDDSAYQVNAIRVGDILIVDRVLLKNISWEDLHEQGFCGSAHNTISKGETTMKSNATIICLDDERYGSCAIACSRENEEKVRNFLVKRYSEWFAKCEGMVGVSPWNNIVDAIRDMKELLGDENLQFLGGCTITRVPTYDF